MTKIKMFVFTDWTKIEDLENSVNGWIANHPEAEIVSVRTLLVGTQIGKFLVEVIYRTAS